MNRNEFIESLKKMVIKNDVKEKIVSVYNMCIPDVILKILSSYPLPELFDENESRTLSLCEVLNCEEDNGIPFKSKKIIPIVDTGNNDFIVYDASNDVWCMYNILDETAFNEGKSFEELFLG